MLRIMNNTKIKEETHISNERYIVEALYAIDQMEELLMEVDNSNMGTQQHEDLREQARTITRLINKLKSI